jgi:hypothetical protein
VAPEHEPISEAIENSLELPQAAPAPPVLPKPILYEQLMEGIAEDSLARDASSGSSLSAQEYLSSSHVKSLRISHRIV